MSHRSHQTPTINLNPSRPGTQNSSSWQTSLSPTPQVSPRTPSSTRHNGTASLRAPEDFEESDDEFDDMEDRRPALHTKKSHTPLLHKDDTERGRTGGYDSPDPPSERPQLFTRRSTMRSRSPDTQAKLATKKKYTYAAFFLGLSLVSFVVQTETAVYIQHKLGWNKAYCML